MIFQFNTIVAMKPVDRDKWYIDPDMVKQIEVEAETVNDALKGYVDIVSDNPYYLEISKTALKRKKKMFVDTKDGAKQTGYVITAKTMFEVDHYRDKWIDKYIDLWVDIRGVEYFFFDGIESPVF